MLKNFLWIILLVSSLNNTHANKNTNFSAQSAQSDQIIKDLIGRTYSQTEILKDFNNAIPFFTEELCLNVEYAEGFSIIEKWSQNQFYEIEVNKKLENDETVGIELTSFYRQCLEEDTSSNQEQGEPYPCIKYGPKIKAMSKLIIRCI